MPAKYFTVEEANKLLTEIKPLMANLLERRAKVVSNRHEIAGILAEGRNNAGNHQASEIALDFAAIERLAKRIRKYGCRIADLNVGLLDFLTEVEGREVYLCWRFGEEKVTHYHDLHTGFGGRKKL